MAADAHRDLVSMRGVGIALDFALLLSERERRCENKSGSGKKSEHCFRSGEQRANL
jgi:hypothetical protein